MPRSLSSRPLREVVVTGVGIVSPIGIGRAAFWQSLLKGHSGVRSIQSFDTSELPLHIGGEVTNFDPKQYVRPRKSLKVMSREIQFAFAAADLAMTDARLSPGDVSPERLGVTFGADMIYCDNEELIEAYRACIVDGQFRFDRWGSDAMRQLFPLWMLKYLPNMPACHIAIAHDARGPCNSIVLGDVSSLAAVAEGARIIQRGQADCMIVGGVGARLHPTCMTMRGTQPFATWTGDPAAACRPFDADRTGPVPGEGAGAFLLESVEHAANRGAPILARVLSSASRFRAPHPTPGESARATVSAATAALQSASGNLSSIDHVNAHGASSLEHDRIEAQALQKVVGGSGVIAPKSFVGNLGAGAGAVEMAVSILALAEGLLPASINYGHPDPDCPISMVVETRPTLRRSNALVLNQARTGQSVAIVIGSAQN